MNNIIVDRWNEICFLLSGKTGRNLSEEKFEKDVIQALRVLDWKEYLGEIDVRPTYQLGAANKIMPDLIIKSEDKRKLFVIEIKQPDVPMNTKFQQQLFSYMRLLKLEYGILIGQAIQIFYDGDLIQQDDPVLLDTIRFERDSEQGVRFAELFSKEGFNPESLTEFTLHAIQNINKAENYRLLLKRIVSDDFTKNIYNLIKQELISDYDAELLDSVLSEIDLTVKAKSQPSEMNVIQKKVVSRHNENHNNKGSLPIELFPASEEDFKKKLLENRVAYITTFFTDGTQNTKTWKIYRLQESSTVIGNLRSRLEFRNGEWQKRGILRVLVTLDE
jgi:hypothetical protein